MAISPAFVRAPPPFSHWWSTKSALERRIVAGLALVVAVAIAWWVAWQPMTRDIVVQRAAIARDAAALADARTMTDEMAGLARTGNAPAAGDVRTDLERVLVQQGLRAAVTQLDWRDGRARLTFAAVNFDALVAALEALQRDAWLRIVEGALTARVEPGTVRAEIVLAR